MLVGVELPSKVSVFPGESMLAVNAVPFALLGMQGENDGLQFHRVWSVQFPPPLDHVAATSPGICVADGRMSLALYCTVQLNPSAWKLVPLENAPVSDPVKFIMSKVSPEGLKVFASVIPKAPASDTGPVTLMTPNCPAPVPPSTSFKVPLASC